MSDQFSISPEGEKFPLPAPDQYPAEFERLKKLTDQHRADGKEIVVVVGVGFVGECFHEEICDVAENLLDGVLVTVVSVHVVFVQFH